MATSKVVDFLEDDDIEINQNSINEGNDGITEGFGFTNHSKEKLIKTQKKLLSNRQSLPIWSVRNELKALIASNDSLIVVGSTGSGKTTQLPQFLYEWNYRKICITQPRRVAATSIAHRVSSEMGSNTGALCGYHVRLDRTISKKTQIQYVTDGILLRECIIDPLLQKYSLIVLDEVHERSLNSDILLALIKGIQSKRKLKVIIMSATLQSDKFSQYFNNAPVFKVEGRTFDVSTLYLAKSESNYLDATLTAILQTHLHGPPGDILVFLTGADEIDSMHSMLRCKKVQNLWILPLHGSLPPHLQRLCFEKTPKNQRKIILATNIAESSVTIKNVKFVIDSGKVKRRSYDALRNLNVFAVEDVSKEESWQRTGRCGRTSKGFCLRLYTEQHFEDGMRESMLPDIVRTNLCSVILQLKSIGIDDVRSFDLLDKPKTENIVDGIGKLMILGALDFATQKLTAFGRQMCAFPLDPIWAKIILSAHKYDEGILRPILQIVAMMNADSIFVDAKQHKFTQFEHESGDHLTMLNVFQSFIANKCNPRWCKQNHLNSRSLAKAHQIFKQLLFLYESMNGRVEAKDADVCEESLYENVCQCLLDGLFDSIAYFDENSKKYKTYSNDQLVDIHPSSMLFGKRPQCILYSSMVKTKNVIWCRYCTQIANEEWLDSIVPNLKLLSSIVVETKDENPKSKNENAKMGNFEPGKAVKRMHSVFRNAQSEKFDFKAHRKKNNLRKGQKMQMQMRTVYSVKQRHHQFRNYGQRKRNRHQNHRRFYQY